MAVFNLIRNARVFFTTNVDAQGIVANSAFSDSTPNTWEIQVLDGLSFSQSTGSETVTLSEAGATPVRGQRAFNTSLEPVDISFSMYMRPNGSGTNVTAEESVLWNAMGAVDPIGGANPAWSETPSVATNVFTNSQKHQLQAFGLIIILDGTSYVIDNCAVDTATVDFGLESIATVQWGLKGTNIRQFDGLTATSVAPITFGGTGISEVQTVTVDATGGTFDFVWSGQTASGLAFDITPEAFTTAIVGLSNVTDGDVVVTGGVGDSGGTMPYVLTWRGSLGNVAEPTTVATSLTGGGSSAAVATTTTGGGLTGTSVIKNTTAPFIANKLSTLQIESGISGTGSRTYAVALTGGSLTISNNLTYLTPQNLGVVNLPTTYFTGTRAVSGSINAYLKTGALNTSGLLSDMLLGSSTDVDPAFFIQLEVGGSGGSTRIEFDMPGAVLTIPTVNTEQVVATAINFTAQGTAGTAFDLEVSNELEIRYYAP